MAVREIANVLNDTAGAVYYADLVERGRKVYTETLWNGTYFDYDSSKSGITRLPSFSSAFESTYNLYSYFPLTIFYAGFCMNYPTKTIMIA